MIKNDNSLWDNLYKNPCESQEKLLNNILKPEREPLKILLENLYSSCYEISFQNKKSKQKMNKETLRIKKNNEHYGYINGHTLDENSLFGYCLGFNADNCPDNFSNEIYGFSPDKGLYIIKIEGSDKGWYVVEGKRKSDQDKNYVLITSLELANKIFNV